MDREQIRQHIFAELKKQAAWRRENHNKVQHYQMSSIYRLFQGPGTPGENVPQWQVDQVISVAREIIQEYVTNGFLYIGTAQDQNSGFPFITITEFGMEVFGGEDWLPYDPDGYLKEIKARVPTIDPVAFGYISEAVRTFHMRALLASSLTLGVASEVIMLELIEAYRTALQDTGRRNAFESSIKDKYILSQYLEFKTEFKKEATGLPKNLRLDWETHMDTFFNFIRINRNNAGHPTGPLIIAKAVFANLQIFANYAGFIYQLIDYLKKNPIL